MNNNKKKNKPKNRFKILIIIMCIVFIAIISRLVYLQVINYTNYKERANKRAIKFISTTAPRGKILDSNGKVLATNKQTYTLTFTETDESKKKFYDTVDRVHKMLTETGESMQDKFQLRLDGNNNFYFDFKAQSPEEKRALELRFKKDRGLNEKVKASLQKEGAIPKGDEELSVEDEEKVDEKLLQITPEETFKYLVKQYGTYYALKEFRNSKDYSKDVELKKKAKEYLNASEDEIFNLLLKQYSLEEIRRYIAVKDAIKIQSFSGFKPVNIACNISEKTAFEFYQKLNDLPGVNVSLEPIRYYPYGELGASVLGYVSSINGSSKNKYEEKGYDISTDIIGRAGIESAFESALKGEKGGETVKVNADGRKTSELFQLETYPGKNVCLTIDRDIQYTAEHMLKDQLTWLQAASRDSRYDTTFASRGATVAIEVNTGRILALASYPSFDPNMFTQGQLNKELTKQYFSPDLEEFGKQFIVKHNLKQTVEDLFPKNKNGQRDDKYDIYPKPFYNYATMGLIPPGSTFKPMTSVVALEEGVVTPDSTVFGEDHFRKYPEIFGKNTPPKDGNCDGVTNIKRALQKSSNSYFYDAAVKLYKKYSNEGKPKEGLDTIYKYAWKFGLGMDPNKKQKPATGIEIAENFGSVYNFERFKKNKIYYSKWTLVNSLENGCFDKSNLTFPSLDIAKNENDSEELATAKEKLKKLIASELELVGNKDIAKEDCKTIEKNVVEILNEIYNNSDKYRKTIEASGKSKDKAISSTTLAITNWMVNSMAFEINSPAQLAYAAIGQGIDAFSPVQIVNYIATLANGGTRYKAHLVDKITDADGNVIEEFKPEVIDKINFSKTTLDTIKEGMRRCNNEIEGTGFSSFGSFPIPTCGKTGTATFSNNEDEVGRKDFGVYVSFAPIDKPKIAVVTAIYDGIHGYFGAPIARAIYETYFRNEIKKDFPSYITVNPLIGEKYDYALNPPLENKQDEEKK
ncbi:penicillin-binding transpeptidase domain-containing protein [Clostridium tarantellae]|uniref:Penicillin-binding protein n=1 Tax=Clostridium tarantellae TaxID=39493 RepID=A0A6I1MHY5_9CLOT|nr:penicillin-binding transpeptidase domain-containing protein [Clostridium tarantellae]MPQ42494.1 penicillin-binding protein [Clostridium tarantellae]